VYAIAYGESRWGGLNQEANRVNVDFPMWMVQGLDKRAAHLGVTRQSLIKMWIAEKLE
jgi:hypothetical protein